MAIVQLRDLIRPGQKSRTVRVEGADFEADTAIDEQDAGPGTFVTVAPERHHGFSNPGPGVLRMICLHAAPRIVQHDLEE